MGIAGTATLYVAERTQVPQSLMAFSRGVGMILGPLVMSKVLGKLIWSGESQYGFGTVLGFKALCIVMIPRLDQAWSLCLAFFGVGAAMAVLDTFNIMLVGRLLKARSGAELAKYDLCYGIGGMVAPYIAILVHRYSWDVLATVDLLMAAVVVRRRACLGKPTDWKQKIRNPGSNGGANGGTNGSGATNGEKAATGRGGNSMDEVAQPVPPKVLRAGLTFAFISQIGSTSISAWGFAYTTKRLGFSEEWAALVPSSFYLASMLPRMANTWLAKRVLASALVHCSLIFVLLGSISVLVSSWMLSNARNSASDASSGYVLMFLGIWFMGTGYANHYSMLLVSMTQHGELTSQQSGMFGSSTCFGITMGLWLAGFVDLAHVEVAIAMLLTAIWTAHIREFPICGTVKPVTADQRDPPAASHSLLFSFEAILYLSVYSISSLPRSTSAAARAMWLSKESKVEACSSAAVARSV